MYTCHESQLGALANPEEFIDPIDIVGVEESLLRRHLATMLLIRLTEEHIGEMVVQKQVRCPCHLGIGQEAVAVGVAAHLNPRDFVFSNHRSHGHFLAQGGTLRGLMHEILGKREGCAGGMGGSQHLVDLACGFVGSVPIVAGTIPLAVGAGLAARKKGLGNVAVSYFGDGAAEEGVLHESLNLASKFRLPVLFVCENNLYSSHLDIRFRQPTDRIARFAEAHCITAVTVDGNDVVGVAEAAHKLIAAARNGEGPGFLEAVTYRWRGHVGPDENMDVGLRRSSKDLAAWKKRDPIRRLFDSMAVAGIMNQEEFHALSTRIAQEVAQLAQEASQAPYPESSSMLDHVYSRK